MKISAEVTNKQITLRKETEALVETFTLPSEYFRALYYEFLRTVKMKDGEKHDTELKTRDELIALEQEQKKKRGKGMAETFKEMQKVARDVAGSMEEVGKSVSGK